ncbi:MAG TPA: hypothetical protein VGF23_09000 [Gaiellaceae bacterium]
MQITERPRLPFLALRVVYRTCYLLMVVTGRAAARLAADFRVLGSSRNLVGPVAIVLQLPVLACWLLVRPISLAAFSACRALAPYV